MAVIYLSSVDGNDADDGSTWALAKATLAAALTAAGAGGTVYVDNAHAETSGSAISLTSPGTAASPTLVLCVSRASGAPPTALATTATVTTTASANITFLGFAYVYGVSLVCNNIISLINSSAAGWVRWEAATLTLNRNSSTPQINCGQISSGTQADQLVEFVNVRFSFANVGHFINVRNLKHTATTGTVFAGTLPPSAYKHSPTGNPRLLVQGVDLSAFGSGAYLLTVGASQGIAAFVDCKLGASVAAVTGTEPGPGGNTVNLVNCDSADTNYRYLLQNYQGSITHETTIVRTGGSSDGATPFSRKFATTANSKFYSPLEGPWFRFWNETVGSVTVTIEIVTDNVTLTNAEAWVEVEYQGTSGFPLSLFANDRAADILATPVNQTASSETWTTTGLTTPVKQALAVTFTTAEKGWVMARAMLAKASTTMYACAKILSTSYKQTMEADGSILNDVDIPAVGEVQTGVQYGADGTERTGTLSAGGGSGEPANLHGGIHQ